MSEATAYLDSFFADLNEPVLLSNCCHAKVLGELFKNFGRCSDCMEMAEFVKATDD
jgi:hypothetical protein